MPEEPLRNINSEHVGRRRSFRPPEFTVTNAFIVVLIFAVVLMALFIFKPDLFRPLTGAKPGVKQEQAQVGKEGKSSGYSAVFLANNQVYFGRLADEGSSYPRLTEVYYLRVQRALQPPPATEEAQPDVQLVKLGNELHGPADEIKFNREQILYIEDLKTDSRIVRAIEEFKARK